MNVIRELLQSNKAYRVADAIGMPRVTIYRLIKGDTLPKSTRLETIERIANHFGYRVEIKLVKKNKGNIQ
jgi:plasmid maintenance system antidote protein VapI